MLKKFLRSKLKFTPRTKRIVGWAVLSMAIALSLAWRLDTLPSAFSSQERLNFEVVRTKSLLSPGLAVGLPYYAALKILLNFSIDPLVLRGFSLALSCAGLVLFYKLCREWWSRTVAISTTAILGTSYWFLLLSRLIGHENLNLTIFCLMLLLFLRLKHESKWWQIMLTGAVAGLAVYFPPILSWLSLSLTSLAMWHSIRFNRGHLPVGWLIYFSSFLAILSPLTYIILNDPSSLGSILGLDTVSSLNEIITNLKAAVRAALWDGRLSPLLLPHVGLLNIAVVVLGLLGFIRSVVTWKLQRSQFMLLGCLAVLIFVGISAQPSLAYSYALPVVYVFVARGFNQYLSDWTKLFPRNRSAHLVSRLVLLSLVTLLVTYNLQTYYVAWAKSDHVKTQFDRQLIE